MIQNLSSISILKEHHINYTQQRSVVLEVFLTTKKVLSLSELSTIIGKEFDRITLYRTLILFEEKGLIHKILDKDAPSYALCTHEAIEHNHSENHVHFKCSKCGNVYCLDEVAIPKIKLPANYVADQFNFLIEGKCDGCNIKK